MTARFLLAGGGDGVYYLYVGPLAIEWHGRLRPLVRWERNWREADR